MVNIIVIGTTGVDYIAVVEKFPSADEKVRSLLSFQCGGGNAGNTSVAISRLGGCCKILSKIGNDSYGEMILKEFRDELVDVDCCIMSTSTLSAFTYVVVDSSSGTRTCIHTPMTEELTPKEINIFVSRSDLSAPLVHFDSRHTLAALEFASKLSERSEENRAILSIDLERIRPHIFDLIPYMDIVFTNLKCVDEFCPPTEEANPTTPEERDVCRALALFDQKCFEKCSVVVCTLGSRGSVMLCEEERDGSHILSRLSSLTNLTEPQDFADWLPNLAGVLYSSQIRNNSEGEGEEFCGDEAVEFPLYIKQTTEFYNGRSFTATWCSAWKAETVVDTTGAGDAFIGGFLTTISKGGSFLDGMAIGSMVASMKLSSLGARTALPTLNTLREAIESFLHRNSSI